MYNCIKCGRGVCCELCGLPTEELDSEIDPYRNGLLVLIDDVDLADRIDFLPTAAGTNLPWYNNFMHDEIGIAFVSKEQEVDIFGGGGTKFHDGSIRIGKRHCNQCIFERIILWYHV
jgi:hypothetical protein